MQVVEGLRPVLRLAGLEDRVLGMPDRRSVLREAARLRALGPRRGVLLTPAFSAALILWLAGVPERRGTVGGGRSLLLTERVDRGPLLRGHRVWEYLALVDPGAPRDGPPPRPRLAAAPARAAWEAGPGGTPSGAGGGERVVALFPGGNAPSRRWPPERFGELARRRVERGERVLVLGGPAERELTRRVTDGAGRAGAGAVVDLGGRTGLLELAGALCASRVLVTNDTGPMHLAAALDVPVLALEGAADVRQTGPLAAHVRLVGRFELPCVPCVRNECPRRGAGYRLPEARRECMALLEVDEVEEALDSLLTEVTERDG